MLSEHIRVRFAPSPTGFLHIGGARTALFNWLFARQKAGTFILRIEDTDISRSTEDYIEAIIDSMRWLGLDWDEGPYRQTDRFEIYRKYVRRLLDEGKAYYCYCSPEELEARRKESMAEGRPLKYNGRCRNLASPVPGVKPVVRFMMPREGKTVIRDLVRGEVSFENDQLDDLIILRSDDTPTYNLTVVVDDVDMGITHVIRGDDHLNNTPRQFQIYLALGYRIPVFAHLPMILGHDRGRLSKRHGATSVTAYRDLGYLSEALVNYLVRLGWSYGDQEIFSRDELIQFFSFENVGKAAAVFNPEKLLWLNARHIMNSSSDRLVDLVTPVLRRMGVIHEDYSPDREWFIKAVHTLKERSKTLTEMGDSLRYYIAEDVEYDEKARKKFLNEKSLELLVELTEEISSLTEYSASELERIFKSIVEKHGVKLGALAQPVRVAMTGVTISPGIFDILEIVGKEKTLRRLQRAIGVIKAS
jgi:glutamyl-tRNA synthetase